MTDLGTQPERILALLRDHPSGVCGTLFLQHHIPTYSQRIGDLRRVKGYTIAKVECPYAHHTHGRNIATYQLLPGVNTEQLHLSDA